DPTAELGEAGDDRHHGGHAVAERGEERCGSLWAAAAEPAEELLGAVPGEDEAHDQSQEEEAVLHELRLPECVRENAGSTVGLGGYPQHRDQSRSLRCRFHAVAAGTRPRSRWLPSARR